MKKIILGLIVLTTTITSCKKTMNVSKVATIPTVVLNGEPAVTVGVGGSYSDAGAVFTDEDGTVSTIQPTTNPLDLNTPGFYTLRYEKHTVSGYNAAAIRVVLVTNVSSSLDYSGVYVRTANGQPMYVKKIGTGLYVTDNVGGVPGNSAYIYDTYFGQKDDSTIVVPVQNGPFGELYCDDPSLTVSPTDTIIKWAVMAPGFGTAVRTFSHE